MKKNWLINGLLLFGVTALGLVLGLDREPAPAASPPTVSALAPATIRRIEIHAGHRVVVLDRKDGDAVWHMRRPVAARADPAQVAALLKLVGTTASRRYPRGAIAERTTGLADPALVVRFNGEAPIAIGGQGPTPGSRYVRTAHALLLAPAPELASLGLTWTHWIDPALVPKNARLTRLVLPRFTLSRGPGDGWRIAPKHNAISARDVRATIAAWQRVKALSVVPADPRHKRRARITLDFAHRRPHHLDVIETRPNLILRDAQLGVAYRLAGNRVAPLLDVRHEALDGASNWLKSVPK